MKLDWHKTVSFVTNDWHSNHLRFILEVINWFGNLVMALTFAVTVPDVPLHYLYPGFICLLCISTYSAISRGSFGLLITTITILLIDIVGYYRLIIITDSFT